MKDFVEITFNPIKGLESVRASILSILVKWWEGHKLGINAMKNHRDRYCFKNQTFWIKSEAF